MIDQLAYGVKNKKKTSGRTSDSIFLSVRAAFQQLGEDEYFCRPAGTCLILFQARSFLQYFPFQSLALSPLPRLT